MKKTSRMRPGRSAPLALFALAAALALSAGPALAGLPDAKYLASGAKQHPTNGGWSLPDKGACIVDPTKATRPECLALRFPTYTSSATCVVSNAPNAPLRSWSTGVCNDTVHAADQATCEAALPAGSRMWSNGVCAVTMKGSDRNVATCTSLGGTWITSGVCTGNWVMPNADTYSPVVITGSTTATAPNLAYPSNPGPGDQCLRCHRTDTEWNGTRVRDVESFLKTGHQNMARAVVAGQPWAGPEGIYPTDDSGNAINWTAGTITVGTLPYSLKWIYGDWLAPLPRAIYADATLNNMSYSCGRCHNTGWTSDASIKTNKEPETTFPGITWDGNAANAKGFVKLGSGVSSDTNVMASWDVWGISCTRCHGSAVDTTSNGGVVPFSNPTGNGISSHHNNLTAADNNSGVCSDPRFNTQAACEATSPGGPWIPQGVWMTACSVANTAAVCTQAITTQSACVAVTGAVWVPVAGFCSNTSYKTQADCTSNAFTWQDGWCTRPDKDSVTCTGGSGTNALSWRANGAQASCQVAGGTWSFSSCSIPATCSIPGYADKTACTTAGGTWTSLTSEYTCIDAGGKYTGNNLNRGQAITGICMQCHRQETSGLPNGATAVGGVVNYSATDPAGQIKVGPYHNTVTFPSHPHSNQFLNSPHGKFTGTFDKIATGKFNYAMTGEYKSFFQVDGEAANTGNGCTGCHNVHKSVVPEANPMGGGVKECTECHAKPLSGIQHPMGVGTPLENAAEACVSCHMPGAQHLFRINTDAAYATMPPSAFTLASGTVNANTAPDGTYTNAVWVDLNAACGQCHGGGTSHATTTGTITAATKTLTVASATGFASGEAVRITGAALAGGLPVDFDTYVASVAGNVVTLSGAAGANATNANVVLNATKNNAAYFNKATLAGYARGMHADKPTAMFSFTYGANGSIINVDAAGSTCSGSPASCDAFTWSWGDGTANGSGKTATHTYAAAGNYTVTLTVDEYGVGSATASQRITAYAADAKPSVGLSSCGFVASTWTVSCTNASTDDNGVAQIVLDWGDGTVLTSVIGAPPAAGPYAHTFLVPGRFNVKLTAIDGTGQSAAQVLYSTDPANFPYYSVAGRVFKAGGTVGLGAATVQIRKAGTLVKSTMTAADGSYTTGNMKPGSYTLTVSKTGYTFTVSTATATIGPSITNQNFTAN